MGNKQTNKKNPENEPKSKSRAEQLLVKGGIRKDLSRETECVFFSMT